MGTKDRRTHARWPKANNGPSRAVVFVRLPPGVPERGGSDLPVSRRPPADGPVGGRLQEFVGSWAQITSDRWVLETIECGSPRPTLSSARPSKGRSVPFSSSGQCTLSQTTEQQDIPGYLALAMNHLSFCCWLPMKIQVFVFIDCYGHNMEQQDLPWYLALAMNHISLRCWLPMKLQLLFD